MEKPFYVYEHTRIDTGMIFYVGKGQKRRAYVSSQRNNYWHKIVNKANGFNVSILAKDLDEELAFLIEMERIDQLKKLNINLCNMTDGGDGSVGAKRSEDFKKKISQAHKGKPKSEKHKAQMSKSAKLKILTEEHKKNIGKALIGKKASEKTKQKMSLRMWITNGIKNKKVLKSSDILAGWQRGRNMEHIKKGTR